ncbi:response regulator [Sandaracinus amylolyticus]|uniref:response regulator n=1 Tax=Sandaracinus amylolyticus TaxID=927083 RepID=UPI001EFF79F9|nr:response regulator [Sandaracinus amylolyticus]UJR80975.1 Translation initiation factor 2 [Sandaracinus amylolyticus]
MPKILGVDDSVTMRRILEMTFGGDPSTSISTVEDGDSAIRWATEQGVDLVLADVSMSGTDGYEVARALRANPATQNVAVVVLASQHSPYDAEKGRQAGVDDHVLKPFETQALLDKVRDVLGRPRAAAAARPVAAAPAAPRPVAPAAPQAAPPSPPRPPSPGVPGVVAPPAQRPPQRATVAFGPPAATGARPATAAPVAPVAPARPAPIPAAAPVPGPVSARKPALELADDDALVSSAPTPAPAPAAPAMARPAAVVTAATSANGEMAGKLEGMGLTPDQVQGVLALSREVIERVVWEVVPDLAETIIREEIRRLTS